jgi:hypothetical protein
MDEEALMFLQSYYDSCQPEYKVITELLTARQTIKRLVDEVTKYRDAEDSVLPDSPSMFGEGARFAYNTVLTLIGEKK